MYLKQCNIFLMSRLESGLSSTFKMKDICEATLFG